LRKVTKSKSIFQNDSAFEKMLFLAYGDLSKKWTCAIKYWPKFIAQLSIASNDRLILDL